MQVYTFFDRLEDMVRKWLSHYPIVYGFVGGVGVVLFWRGVWHTADFISYLIANNAMPPNPTINLWGLPVWDGLLSLIIGSVLLLLTGLFVSSFIGAEIIISGLRGEKKLAEKTESEVQEEASVLAVVTKKLEAIEKHINELKKKVDGLKD